MPAAVISNSLAISCKLRLYEFQLLVCECIARIARVMMEANEDGESVGGAVVRDEPAGGFGNYAYQILL